MKIQTLHLLEYQSRLICPWANLLPIGKELIEIPATKLLHQLSTTMTKKNYDLTLHQYFNLSSIAIPESPDHHKEVWEYALDNKQLAYTQSGTNDEQLQDHHRHYSQDRK